MCLLIVALRHGRVCRDAQPRLSVEHPSRFQIVLEDAVLAFRGLLDEWIGPKGHNYLPLITTLGIFILLANYAGLVPGLMAPTSSINVTLGCALTIWTYYHFQGIREQGVVKYILHFGAPPGSPVWLFPIMFPIEVISHMSRVLSLSLRLFGNIFGEELLIMILASIVPFIVPLPIMFLGLITGGLQAFIFVLLSIIYLQGAVAVDATTITSTTITRTCRTAACARGRVMSVIQGRTSSFSSGALRGRLGS